MEKLDPGFVAPGRLDALLLDPLPLEVRQRLLRLSLGGQDHVLVPLEQITEILHVEPAAILPIPEMPRCVLGIGNWRGEMLWLVDLDHLIGFPTLLQEPESSFFTVLVVQFNHQFVGIRVPQVKDIELHDLQQLQPALPSLFPPNLLPLILGILPESCDAVLNLQAIAQYPLWNRHPKKGV
ncbi:chemotaxis protein CheW [Leptolyngbya ohadii]|uniref:chemotaxis protein CheW n=1 Tax=Leptolyngbya ohadii TaxID=1962290 RepID=UPI000B5A1EED|nr:chemotaxis protein CheW [Leptolyngbya ohadii]